MNNHVSDRILSRFTLGPLRARARVGAVSMGREAHGRTAAPPGGGGRALNGTLPAGVAVNAHGEVSLPLNNLRRLAELDLRRVSRTPLPGAEPQSVRGKHMLSEGFSELRLGLFQPDRGRTSTSW